jgi:hypothetical protein
VLLSFVLEVERDLGIKANTQVVVHYALLLVLFPKTPEMILILQSAQANQGRHFPLLS